MKSSSALTQFAFLAAILLAGSPSVAATSLTLERAIELAEAYNADLPVAQLGAGIADQNMERAKGALGPGVSITGNVPYGPPTLSYSPAATAVEASLLLNVQQPVYAGNMLQGSLEAARDRMESAEEGYQVSSRNVAFMVRSRFSEVLFYDAEIAIEKEGVERLRNYLSTVRSRRASGQGLEADYLKTKVRVAEQEALLISAQRSRAEAAVELNVLLGREPAESLELAPLPKPTSDPLVGEEDLSNVPDLMMVVADQRASVADLSVVKGKFLPHVGLFANTGLVDPGIGPPNPNPSLDQRLRADFGVSAGVNLSWNIWDFGSYRAEISEARLQAEQNLARIEVTRRRLSKGYQQARVDIGFWYKEYETRDRQVPTARDSYLASESLYRGGRGMALGVLDSFNTLVQAETLRARALLELRIAQAMLIRNSGGTR